MNKQVALQNDISAEVFSKALLDISNGRIPVDPSTGLISFPPNFFLFTTSKKELISKVFLNIDASYKIHAWLTKRAILAPKNMDINYLNTKIQSQWTNTFIKVDRFHYRSK